MEAALFLYFASILDDIKQALFAIVLVGIIMFPFYPLIIGTFEYKSNKWVFIVPFVAGTFALILPSERTMYMMAAGYFGQTIVQSEQASEVGNKMMKIINGKLDEYINEMSSSKETLK